MKNSSNKIVTLHTKSDETNNKTAQPKQVIAQLEAYLARKETQKVSEKCRTTN
tara:strand:- start:146 stop:304 length:159 start_codon:yes stop_codon:yes gene_type:complete